MNGAHNFAWGPGGVLEDAGTYYTPGLAHRSGGVDRFYHADALGSTRWLSDTNGAFTNGLRYDAYGKKTGQTGGSWQPVELFLFAGAWGYHTEHSTDTEPGLGLHYLQQRYYDPETGRFISPDSIGYAGGLNLYAYCGNDPINRVDPSGLAPPDSIETSVEQALLRGELGEALQLLELAPHLRGQVLNRAVTSILGSPVTQRILHKAVTNLPLSVPALGARLANCEKHAVQVYRTLQQLGGSKFIEIYKMTPKAGSYLPLKNGGGSFFGVHYCVRIGNHVIDSMTGVAGQSWHQWIQRWQYIENPRLFYEIYRIEAVGSKLAPPP